MQLQCVVVRNYMIIIPTTGKDIHGIYIINKMIRTRFVQVLLRSVIDIAEQSEKNIFYIIVLFRPHPLHFTHSHYHTD